LNLRLDSGQYEHAPVVDFVGSCYNSLMSSVASQGLSADLPSDLASELERKFFWWENVTGTPRSHARILAQAMSFASFDDIRYLERRLGPDRLADAMFEAQPGWIDDRSWNYGDSALN